MVSFVSAVFYFVILEGWIVCSQICFSIWRECHSSLHWIWDGALYLLKINKSICLCWGDQPTWDAAELHWKRWCSTAELIKAMLISCFFSVLDIIHRLGYFCKPKCQLCLLSLLSVGIAVWNWGFSLCSNTFEVLPSYRCSWSRLFGVLLER